MVDISRLIVVTSFLIIRVSLEGVTEVECPCGNIQISLDQDVVLSQQRSICSGSPPRVESDVREASYVPKYQTKSSNMHCFFHVEFYDCVGAANTNRRCSGINDRRMLKMRFNSITHFEETMQKEGTKFSVRNIGLNPTYFFRYEMPWDYYRALVADVRKNLETLASGREKEAREIMRIINKVTKEFEYVMYPPRTASYDKDNRTLLIKSLDPHFLPRVTLPRAPHITDPPPPPASSTSDYEDSSMTTDGGQGGQDRTCESIEDPEKQSWIAKNWWSIVIAILALIAVGLAIGGGVSISKLKKEAAKEQKLRSDAEKELNALKNPFQSPAVQSSSSFVTPQPSGSAGSIELQPSYQAVPPK